MRLKLRPKESLPDAWFGGETVFLLVRRAEDAGFEPARGCPQHAFQACALGH